MELNHLLIARVSGVSIKYGADLQLGVRHKLAEAEGVEPSLIGSEPSVLPLHHASIKWWSLRDSNPSPSECHSDALPNELRPHAMPSLSERHQYPKFITDKRERNRSGTVILQDARFSVYSQTIFTTYPC